MAFTKALYYPYIDIEDSGWLKTSMLYWDEIQTIVPSSVKTPYENATSAAFHDAGTLLPLTVESSRHEIEELADDMLEYLDSPEAAQLLLKNSIAQGTHIRSNEDLERIERAFLYPEKLPYIIRELLEDTGQNILLSDPKFGLYYMTLLASHISTKKNISLLTDIASSDALAGTVRLDSRARFDGIHRFVDYEFRGRRHHRRTVPELAEACLATLVMEGVRLDPETPADKIIKFRGKHRDELGKFRAQIGRLASAIKTDHEATSQDISQQAQIIMENELLPALGDLKASLRSERIKFVVEKLIKACFFCSLPTGVASHLLELSAPQALLAGSAVSLVASLISYNVDRAEKLRNNPYSYLLSARRFGAATRLAAQQIS
jgi:beta-phosphoglucomutase-like phosphatase (HAD superfamily)